MKLFLILSWNYLHLNQNEKYCYGNASMEHTAKDDEKMLFKTVKNIENNLLK